MIFKPPIGKKFGRLTVVSFLHRDSSGRGNWVLCSCDCGGSKTVLFSKLGHHINSCGCLKREGNNTKHGCGRPSSPTREYRVWVQMKARCTNPNIPNYVNYGGRGIMVCDRWRNNFQNFIDDIGLRPSKYHSLDRIDPNGNYEPSNCRWATVHVQTRNRRNNHWIEYGGERMIHADWAKRFKTTRGNLRQHLLRKSFADCYTFFTTRTRVEKT